MSSIKNDRNVLYHDYIEFCHKCGAPWDVTRLSSTCFFTLYHRCYITPTPLSVGYSNYILWPCIPLKMKFICGVKCGMCSLNRLPMLMDNAYCFVVKTTSNVSNDYNGTLCEQSCIFYVSGKQNVTWGDVSQDYAVSWNTIRFHIKTQGIDFKSAWMPLVSTVPAAPSIDFLFCWQIFSLFIHQI